MKIITREVRLLTHIGESLSGFRYNSTLDNLHGLRHESYLAGYVERGVDLGKADDQQCVAS